MPTEDAYSSGTPWSCPTLGLACVLMSRPISPNLSCLRTFEFRTPLGTSLLPSTCLFLMEVWMTEGPRVNFVMREALFEIYTWILWLWNIRVLIHNSAVFRTAIGTAGSYVTGTASWKNICQNFSHVHRSWKHWECKYYVIEVGLIDPSRTRTF